MASAQKYDPVSGQYVTNKEYFQNVPFEVCFYSKNGHKQSEHFLPNLHKSLIFVERNLKDKKHKYDYALIYNHETNKVRHAIIKNGQLESKFWTF